jgi:hypothetical protein
MSVGAIGARRIARYGWRGTLASPAWAQDFAGFEPGVRAIVPATAGGAAGARAHRRRRLTAKWGQPVSSDRATNDSSIGAEAVWRAGDSYRLLAAPRPPRHQPQSLRRLPTIPCSSFRCH